MPLLCPYRTGFGPNFRDPELFGECYQERCAMWRTMTTDSFVAEKGGYEYKPVIKGYCGVAGRPETPQT